MLKMHLFVLLLMLVTGISAGPLSSVSRRAVRYDGYHLLEVGPLNTKHDIDLVTELSADRSKVISINNMAAVGHHVTILVSPIYFEECIEKFRHQNIAFTVLNENYQRVIDENDLKNAHYSAIWKRKGTFDHTSYLSYDEQVTFLETICSTCRFCDLQFIGETYEGQQIILFSINNQNSSLPAIWLDANMEAQQWITSATTLYIIDQIANGVSSNAVYMRTNFRIYIMPNVNPDGYKYTRQGDRLWSKNRSVNDSAPSPDCTGVLLSRNFQVGFGGLGASSDCRDPTYHGAFALSESETQAMREAILATQHLNVYVTLHSYKQQWVIPWWFNDSKPSDYDELKRVARIAVRETNNTNNYIYSVGTPEELGVAPLSGMSSDWAKATMNIPYSYHVNLRPDSAGSDGYLIGPENIIPSGNEILNGFTAVCREARFLR